MGFTNIAFPRQSFRSLLLNELADCRGITIDSLYYIPDFCFGKKATGTTDKRIFPYDAAVRAAYPGHFLFL
jgi:hypothetical protein